MEADPPQNQSGPRDQNAAKAEGEEEGRRSFIRSCPKKIQKKKPPFPDRSIYVIFRMAAAAPAKRSEKALEKVHTK
jgi:hypothetical protein